MARPRYKVSSDLCADCGALGPTWASLNRAILLCDECCSIHRSLGRHISNVKSLQKGAWNSCLLSMVYTLNDNGANSIWEHSLLDPSNSKISRRKPQPKDPLHPVKADFIKAKHQQLAFVLRPSKDEICSEEELSRQLHSSVRTSNLETSLRLLAQGANPNYFYKEKGTTPLHVAARAGQSLQLELLILNGGNPSIMDMSGQTPAEVAQMRGHLELYERLVECMFEVTDRLTLYVCSRKPDHRTMEHLIIPEWAGTLERAELTFEARNRLQMLPNYLLEELAMDVYDEVDRRETESIWLSSATLPERCTVPFLPVNPQLSSTRNQGRQKLARFTPKEFATLIIDLLTEAGHRHTLSNSVPLRDPVVSMLRKEQVNLKHGSQMSDDEPLYDSVASDDDYAALTSTDSQITQLPSKLNLDNEKVVGDLMEISQSAVSNIVFRVSLLLASLFDHYVKMPKSIERLYYNRQLFRELGADAEGRSLPNVDGVIDCSQIRYNQVLVVTRRIVEQTFGIWEREFPVLSIGFRTKPVCSTNIIMACAALHNMRLILKNQLQDLYHEDNEERIIFAPPRVAPGHGLAFRNELIERIFE